MAHRNALKKKDIIRLVHYKPRFHFTLPPGWVFFMERLRLDLRHEESVSDIAGAKREETLFSLFTIPRYW